jgi:hypothetical protein
MDDEIDLEELLQTAPLGTYLLERAGGWRFLWRVTAGDDTDDEVATLPAGDWRLLVSWPASCGPWHFRVLG